METEKAQLRNLTGRESYREPLASSRRKRIKWPLPLGLVRRRVIWCPTGLATFLIGLLLLIPAVWWFNCGESFLSVTDRLQPEVLVVEGWIGFAGVRAAEAEFEQHRYQYIVATGDLHTDPWAGEHLSLAELAGRELLRLGVPADKIIVAPAVETERDRTYQSSMAVRRALLARGIRPKTLNVFTWGPHARRSRLIFAKVEGPGTKVGVVSWVPANYRATPWWSSSWRAKTLMTETAGYLYESLLNSGRNFSKQQ
jgi:uncharacterized SAM-binding protein YcdF (DUF218 family)